jgi:hypothetical protein
MILALLKSEVKQNCKNLEYATDNVAVYSVNQHSRICVLEVVWSNQRIQVYLKESGFEVAQNKCLLYMFNKKGDN